MREYLLSLGRTVPVTGHHVCKFIIILYMLILIGLDVCINLNIHHLEKKTEKTRHPVQSVRMFCIIRYCLAVAHSHASGFRIERCRRGGDFINHGFLFREVVSGGLYQSI